MAQGAYTIAAELGEGRIFVADSITYFSDLRADDVVVCGSHGGETAALFGAACVRLQEVVGVGGMPWIERRAFRKCAAYPR